MAIVRFTGISIDNFKNVSHGEVGFLNKRIPDGPSILALYGQNGSGKTALIDCLRIFKDLFMQRPIPSKYADCITKGKDSAQITYSLEVRLSEDKLFDVKYFVEFARQTNSPVIDTESDAFLDDEPQRARVLAETLSYKESGVGRMKVACSSVGTNGIKPKSAIKKAYAKEGNDSIAEDRELIYRLGLSCMEDLTNWSFDAEEAKKRSRALSDIDWDYDMCGIYDSLQQFAKNSLFVADADLVESVGKGSLRLFYDNSKIANETIRGLMSEWETIELPTTLEGAREDILITILDAVESTVESVNSVLSKLIPGMQLILNRSRETDQGMQKAYLSSLRGGHEIDLANESRGIQKLVSVTWLLIGVYCYQGFTAAIDELDAGIFEFLLGQIFDIIQEGGEGQLIFTSHNLRPVERLDKGYVAFTTQNPDNRYIRLKNIEAGHNRRDFYFSAIQQGGQDECIYDFTTDGELSLAFINAGGSYDE